MLIHKQRSLYDMSDEEKRDLTDIVLVAINEVTKFDPENSEESRYDIGIDLSNIPPFNPYMVSKVLRSLGYEQLEDGFNSNGWQLDYWDSYEHHDMKKFPYMQISGTGYIHQCHLHGYEEDYNTYPHLEDDPEYTDRIKHGIELIQSAMNRSE